ncbi:acyltransferase [Leptothoe sp. LEGE 181152]|nr:acyltransferase [Leptothoe sp. LEGE 181152]
MVSQIKLKEYVANKLYEWTKLAEKKDLDHKKRAMIGSLKLCGHHLTIRGNNSRISGTQNIEIGHNVHIGENAFIRGEGGLKIGDNTHISRNLVLYTVNHQYHGTYLPYDHTTVKKTVEIGRNVWIGMNVCITPGSKIGDGAIVGMGAVIAGEVPPLSIVGNQKFRILGYRDPEHYQRLEENKAYGGVNGRPLQLDNK